MADHQITCITKPHPHSAHEHITHLGNPSANWTETREQIIRYIDAGTHTFFVKDSINGKRADVRVVREHGKAPYVRTVADGRYTDNLLSLNQCPLR